MASSRLMAGVCIVAALAATPAAHAQNQVQRIVPTGALTSDIFSYDLAFDGTVIVAGAPFATYSGVSQPGRAFIFEKSGGTWQQTAKLQPPVLQQGAAFGVQVAAGSGPEGEIVVIGAPSEDGGFENSGAAYVFTKLGPIWTLVQRLTAPSETFHGNFGVCLSVSEGRVAVGSNGAWVGDVQYAGTVYVYEKVGGLWTLVSTVEAPDAQFNGTFGTVVSIDGDRMLVGAPLYDTEGHVDSGRAYFFERSGSSWSLKGTFQAESEQDSAQYGSAGAVRGGLAAVGTPKYNSDAGQKTGTVETFRLDGASWQRTAVLTAPAPMPNAYFGVDLAIDARTLLIGAYQEVSGAKTGVAHVFREHAGAWAFSASLTASDSGGTLFGWRLGLASDTAVIGGPFYQTNRGAAYVFESMRACSADMDGSGFVDTDDFDAFVVAYEAGAAHADMDGSGFVDTDDFDAFVTAYEAGC